MFVIRNRLLRLLLLLFALKFCYSQANSQCGDSNDDSQENSKTLPFQNELEQIFDAFDKDKLQQMENMSKFLQNKEIDETNDLNFDHANNPFGFVPNCIEADGYPVEDHEIITDDGYILHIYRLPHGKQIPKTNNTRPTRPPVLLMHGIFSSSHSWIALGSDNSLAYLLADAGYDVWLANARGTQPSRTHVRMPSDGLKQKEYWSFSWHEIGVFDLPAMIDHILAKTNQKQLNYIGYSQGTTVFFVMTSMRPDYNDKILGAHLMAPVASLKNNFNAFYKNIVRFYKPLRKVSEILRIYKITSTPNFLMKVSQMICTKFNGLVPCKFMNKMVDSSQINCTVLPSMGMNMASGGGSLRQCFHYLQMVRNREFSLFDYESKRTNMRMYGRETPPSYNLTQITAPVNLYFSKDDDTATMKDAIQLQSQLPNHKSSYLIPIDDFRHIDFTYSRYVRQAVNDRLIHNMNVTNRL